MNKIPLTHLRRQLMQNNISPAARAIQRVAVMSLNNPVFYGAPKHNGFAHPRQTTEEDRSLWSFDFPGEERWFDKACQQRFGPWERRMYWSYDLLWKYAKVPLLVSFLTLFSLS